MILRPKPMHLIFLEDVEDHEKCATCPHCAAWCDMWTRDRGRYWHCRPCKVYWGLYAGTLTAVDPDSPAEYGRWETTYSQGRDAVDGGWGGGRFLMDTDPQRAPSLLGWFLFINGAVLIAAPELSRNIVGVVVLTVWYIGWFVRASLGADMISLLSVAAVLTLAWWLSGLVERLP